MASKSVGIIGLGIMGSAMSASLLQDGYTVLGYDLRARRRRVHQRAGGIAPGKCSEVAERVSVIITSLPSAAALLETAAELASSARRGQIVIETSTLPIVVKQQAHNLLAQRGITLLDCPLSGTGAQARTKDLVVYASGNLNAYRRVAAVMDGFARSRYYLGPFGAGSKMKYVANLLVAIHNVAAAEAMVLAMKSGLEPATVLKVIADGAGGSRMLQLRGPMMVKGDYSRATMKGEVWQKDMEIIAAHARELECPTPLFAASAPIYRAAMRMGLGAQDTAAVCAVLEKMAGVTRSRRRKQSR